MNVPATEVDRLVDSMILEGETRESSPVALRVLESEGGPVTPVVEVTPCGFGVLEVRYVGERETLSKQERDRRLLRANLT